MPKLNFKDYLDNYEEIKTEEKNTEKINDLKYQKELAEEVNQEYLVLKEYLEILKRSINNSSMSKTDIEKNINNNIGNITLLRVKTYTLCKKSKIFSDGFDTLKGTIGNLCMLLAILIGC